MGMRQSPLLSVVITSYTTERLKDVYELLDSLKAQTYPSIETVFVAERSNELYERVKAYAEEKAIPNVKVIFNDGDPGLSIARNLGIKHSNGEIIAFTDDDALPFPDWAEQVVRALENSSAIGVTGSAYPLWEDDSLKWLPEEFYWLVSCIAWTGWKEARVVRGAFGTNMAFKKIAFANDCLFSPSAGYARGSHHQPVSDDLEFSLRVRRRSGKDIIYSPDIQILHRVCNQHRGLGFIIARSHQVGCTRRIIKRQYSDEFGTLDQEQQVLKGMLRIILNTPMEFVTKPVIALKKLFFTFVILTSIAIGYLVPIPFYSPVSKNKS
jgi:GT2 family glycosyltransferase